MSNLAESIFDDIRPYYDSEIPQAMHRIAASDYLPQLADFVFPDKTYDEVADLLRGHGLTVETGRFQTHMQITLRNDGPVTLLLDSNKLF